jgi:hypothetical protein
MFTLPTSTKQICALFSSVDTPISCVVVPGLDWVNLKGCDQHI